MLKFVEDNVGGVGTKRASGHKACSTCKKRHKRCHHNDSVSKVPAVSTRSQGANVSRGDSPQEERASHALSSPQIDLGQHDEATQPQDTTEDTRRGQDPDELAEGAYLRFIGDLNPEASFLRRYPQDSTAASPTIHEIGVWQDRKSQERSRPEHTISASDIDVEAPEGCSIRRSGLVSLQALSPYLRKECISVMPPEYEYETISKVFYSKFDTLFPILHGQNISELDVMDSTAIKQCICLTAAPDPSLRPHLRLPHTEAILSPLEFRSYLAAAVKQSLDMGFIRDKIVLLQVHALMAFSSSEANGSEISSIYCAQAVLFSQTLGLHLSWPEAAKAKRSRCLYWCVRVLDRLNAATNGRPILMHDRDVDKYVNESIEEQVLPFRLLIRISGILDAVIAQYRPHPSGETQVPPEVSFEELVRDTQASGIGDGLLASLEVFFSAVMILRDRPNRQGNAQEQISQSPTQVFHAMNIVSLLTEDLQSTITYWAIVPYGIALATSVAYRLMRNSSILYKRKRARLLLCSGCDALDELTASFPSALKMAKLAKSALREFDRAGTSTTSTTIRGQRLREGNPPVNLENRTPGGETPLIGSAVSQGPNNGLNLDSGLFCESGCDFAMPTLDTIWSNALDIPVTSDIFDNFSLGNMDSAEWLQPI
ncbi:hypothetical protein PFICI_13869 [Pestalotiopsis fici W106-1]|uniref:Xylanolytic transcriptional activator regulatory domain-containing protein n=1 Tax=Pestalotiopsis fici (strain W106-1 / CGMCC3.15140) TaxID=1229662 RepID=W3WJE6_PESFW|nr:uncharacterized protein PFICI_13869 [Pestalotiopsis fici W106-1]ETS74003.1 hypothetical protein PFICI_13869 [Pestalotiopsis fici W106-1]